MEILPGQETKQLDARLKTSGMTEQNHGSHDKYRLFNSLLLCVFVREIMFFSVSVVNWNSGDYRFGLEWHLEQLESGNATTP